MNAGLAADRFPAAFSIGGSRPLGHYRLLQQKQPGLLHELYRRVRKIAQRFSTFSRPTPRVDNVYPIWQPTLFVDATAAREQEMKNSGKKIEPKPAVIAPPVPGAKAAAAKAMSAIKAAARAIFNPMATPTASRPAFMDDDDDSAYRYGLTGNPLNLKS